MDKLNWIESSGGPLVLISDREAGFWSGILKTDKYLVNIEEESEDFLNPDETDYGKACMINNYLGLVKIHNEDVLIVADEPMLTTFFVISQKPVLARWIYGENKTDVNNFLMHIELNLIENWEFEFRINFFSDKQFLFDSADSFDSKTKHYLEANIKKGCYKILTALYEPNDKTKLLLHKFEIED